MGLLPRTQCSERKDSRKKKGFGPSFIIARLRKSREGEAGQKCRPMKVMLVEMMLGDDTNENGRCRQQRGSGGSDGLNKVGRKRGGKPEGLGIGCWGFGAGVNGRGRVMGFRDLSVGNGVRLGRDGYGCDLGDRGQRGVEDALVIEGERFDSGGTGPEMSWDGQRVVLLRMGVGEEEKIRVVGMGRGSGNGVAALGLR
ncbi:hypothetical protein MRB53_033144 [Persea americana]|uniref:Uncharacterized protein n=1 Tax=Persea americana TaxID=3435 RepID=A0ACC2KV09_PERAE|nr:hypothetical protein MRB53_033144 [Persea americana]